MPGSNTRAIAPAIIPGQATTLTVNDADLDIDPASADTATVAVRNMTTGETESVVLTETGPATGVFSSMLATRFGTSGTDEDAVLEVTRWMPNLAPPVLTKTAFWTCRPAKRSREIMPMH